VDLTPYRAPLSRPVDFPAFWSSTLDELAAIPPATERAVVDTRGSLVLEDVSFASLNRARIFGYVLRWDDTRRRPLLVHSHGYGGHCVPMWQWASRGIHVVGVDIRGFGRSREVVQSPSRWGFMLTGRQAPEHHVLRGAVCDYLRAAQVGHELLSNRVSRNVFQGTSFAGGLAWMAAALSQSQPFPPDLLAVGVPTFGWAEGRHLFAGAGSAVEISRFLAGQPPQAAEDLMVVLRYFDPLNFAQDIRSPSLVALSRKDEVVPSETVLAMVAHLRVPYELLWFPVSHSDSPEERHWAQFEKRLLSLTVDGLPDGFGRGNRRSLSFPPPEPLPAPRPGTGA
jgi:cephalosporin-C deacetylase